MTADDIADGVVSLLNALTTTLAFEAFNPQTPRLEREAADLAVQVYGFGEDEEKVSRGAVAIDFLVNVLVTRDLDDGTTRQTMTAFVKELKAALRFSSVGRAVWQSTETVTYWAAEHRDEQNQFTSLFRLRYRDIE